MKKIIKIIKNLLVKILIYIKQSSFIYFTKSLVINLKKLFIYIKKNLLLFLNYIKYDYHLTVWRFVSRCRIFFNFLKKYSGLSRRVLFVLFAVFVSFLITYFDRTAFTQDILSNYLFAVAAMTGGTIAIVFTISIFLLQNASDLYSSQYFEIYIHDWKEKFVYFAVIVITIFLFGTGLFVGGTLELSKQENLFITFSSLILIGIVFALIDWQYKNVRGKINPVQAIDFLENEGVKFLKKVDHDAKKIAHIIKLKNGKTSEGMAAATTYNHFLQPLIDRLDGQLENLFEISARLSDKQEIATVKRGFNAIYKILGTFFEARKNSSIAIPSGIAFLAFESDSQNFLSRNFERLNKIGEKFIEENKEDLASYIIDIYKALIIKASSMEFIGGRGENPIFDSIAGYLNLYIDFGIQKHNTEVVFQGARVIGDVSKIAAVKGFSIPLKSAQGKLFDIVIFGITYKQTVIIDRCSDVYLNILDAIFKSKKIIKKHHFDDSLKYVAAISRYIDNALKSGFLTDSFQIRISISKAYDEFETILARIMSTYNSIVEDREKAMFRRDLAVFIEEFNSSLRTLSEQIKSCDSFLVDSISRAVFSSNELMIILIQRADFVDVKHKFESILGWNVHLLSFFVSYAEKIEGESGRFDSLTDCISKTGILVSEKLANKSLVLDCVKSLYSITKQCIEKIKGGYGYAEPRIFQKACYLGILALKHGWRDIVTEIGLMIYEFEKLYFDKYLKNLPKGIDPMNHDNVIGLPHPDQLLREIWLWERDYDKRESMGVFGDDPGVMMYGFVDEIDIDRFIYEIWATFEEGGQLYKEIELKIVRKNLLNTLNRIGLFKKH